MTDTRVERREAILFALYEKPVAISEAVELIDELATLEADMQRNPVEVEFGSAAWFQAVQEIPLPEAVELDDNNPMASIEGFPLFEADRIVQIYACSQCEGDLVKVPSEWDPDTWLIECPDCGNIELIGRISKTTVAIRRERGVAEYYNYLRKHPDLWGDLLEKYRTEKIKPVQVRDGETRKDATLRELGF